MMRSPIEFPDYPYFPWDGGGYDGPMGTPGPVYPSYVPNDPGPVVVPNTTYTPPVQTTTQAPLPNQTPTPAQTTPVPAPNESGGDTFEIDSQTLMIAGGILAAILILK